MSVDFWKVYRSTTSLQARIFTNCACRVCAELLALAIFDAADDVPHFSRQSETVAAHSLMIPAMCCKSSSAALRERVR
jgi:hypothetical protein